MEVVNVRAARLREHGYADLRTWLTASPERNVYIGRGMPYVDGASHSKWHNPFTVKKYGLDECLRLYEKRVREDLSLWASLPELRDKTLGCWCVPESRCHGQVLARLVREEAESSHRELESSPLDRPMT